MHVPARFAIVAAAAILTACSSQAPSSSSLPSIKQPTPDSGSGLSPAEGDAKFIECAKAHGASIPPGFNPRHKPDLYRLSDTVNQACDSILQDSQPPMSAAQRKAWLDYVQCMRDHGIPTSDPVFGRGQVTITFGKGVDNHSAAFQSARQICSQRTGAPGSAGSG